MKLYLSFLRAFFSAPHALFISTWLLVLADNAIAQKQNDDKFPGLLEIVSFLPETPYQEAPKDVFSIRLASFVVTDHTASEALRRLCAQVSLRMDSDSHCIKTAFERPRVSDKQKLSLVLHNVTVAEVLEHLQEATRGKYVWKWGDRVVHVRTIEKTPLDQNVRKFKVEKKRAYEVFASLCRISDPEIFSIFVGQGEGELDLGETISFEKQGTNLRECLLEVLKLCKGCGHWGFRDGYPWGQLTIHCGR